MLLQFMQDFAKILMHGGIGEVVNTPDCGSGMREFDPHIPPQNVIYP